jgi:thiamine pyrophosphate-dependent acetolactate synthase large subunit-like protein
MGREAPASRTATGAGRHQALAVCGAGAAHVITKLNSARLDALPMRA